MKKGCVNNFMNSSFNFKKAQISIFIIIVVVVVAVAGVAYYLTDSDKQFSSDPAIQEQFDTLRDSVLTCSDITTIEALNAIGIQGGYYDAPEKSFDMEWAFIPYYYYEGTAIVPSIATVENELGKFVNDNLPLCLESLDKNDFTLDYKTSKTNVEIVQGDVNFIIDMPVSISREKRTVTFDLKDTPKSYSLPLVDILDLAKYIADEAVKNDENLCLTCIAKEAENRNLMVDLVNFEEAGTLLVITENYTASGQYSLEFLNKYKE
ncbi:MAG: hypothetical protein WC979_09305 [Candidatus Pacearchaeota archaeon]|jgi:hypothetical protein